MRSPRAWARVPLPPAAPAPGPRAEPAFLARVRPRPPRCSAPARGTAARDARGPESAETRPPPGRAPGCCRGPGTAALSFEAEKVRFGLMYQNSHNSMPTLP
ncbi:visual system homeobox 1-like [Manis pentadactyla]|uniref:visual system homeobox 1-like n=1 Tax=Manis pentadactyla TaxID=143292 RepID=UPI00255CEE5D|nr:visual system homeobox 1-like [Manis pentadactyla]